MTSRKGGIDFANWDHLELSDDDEESPRSSPQPSILPVPETAPLAIGQSVNRNEILGEDAIHGEGDLEGIAMNPSTRAVVISDQSKVFRTEDGTLMYGKLDGEKMVIGRAEQNALPHPMVS